MSAASFMGVARSEGDSGKEKVGQQRNSLKKKKKEHIFILFKRMAGLDNVCKLRERMDLGYSY